MEQDVVVGRPQNGDDRVAWLLQPLKASRRNETSNLSEQDVVVGRPRDGDDRVAWLLQRRRYREALAIAATDRSLRKHNHQQVGI